MAATKQSASPSVEWHAGQREKSFGAWVVTPFIVRRRHEAGRREQGSTERVKVDRCDLARGMAQITTETKKNVYDLKTG